MLEQIRAAWDNIEPRRRITLALTAAGVFIALCAVAYWSAQPTYSILYGDLAPEDAAAIVDELRSAKVPYRLGAGGSSIEVPAGALYETRLSLASKGMPSRSGVGFELFDRSSLPGTDFSNTVNLQRALQGELCRTISALDEVRSARVHLSMPRESLYEDPVPPSASVLLDLGGSGSLASSQVRGIAYLVASAVDKLTPDNVTIINSAGGVLRSGRGPSMDLSETTLAAARAYSETLAARLQTMMDAMFGPYQTIVKVQAELDLDTEQSSEEKVEPAAPDVKNAVSREHTSEERYDSSGSGAGGVSGIPSNILGGGSAAGREGSGDYESTELTREYEFSRTTTHREARPGRIKRLTVAAVVDESIAVAGTQRIEEILAAAAGIDRERGDTIVVRPMKLKAAELADKENKALELAEVSHRRQRTIELLIQRGMPAVLGLVLLAVFLRTAGAFHRAATGPGVSSQDGTATSQGGTGDADARAVAQAVGPAPPPPPPPPPQLTPEQQEEQALVGELQRLAEEQPDALADQLRGLVSGQDET